MKLERRNNPVKQVRKDHKVPGVIYGSEIQPTSISVDAIALRKALQQYGTSMTFEVTLDKETHLVYIKDLQTDYLHNYAPTHVDLMKVSADDTITSAIPLHFLHRDEVGKAGEVVSTVMNVVQADTKVGKGVSSLDVDLLLLNERDAIYVSDIVVPEGVTLLHEPGEVVANLSAVAELVTESDADELDDIVEEVEETEEEL